MSPNDAALTRAIRVEVAAGVARLTLDRPPLNILDLATLAALGDALDSLAGDARVQVLTVTGAGTKAFSAGVDIKDHTPEKVPEMLDRFHHVVRRLHEFPAPTVALVRGAALGGGCELACACDVVIAEDGARFGQPEIDVGCFPPVSAILLPRLVGPRLAFEMLILGRVLDAALAREAGLVSQVAPAGSLEKTGDEWILRIQSKSPAVVRLARDAMNPPPEMGFADALARAERIYLDRLMKTADAAEGVQAFLEKRKPVWQGS